ncbi:YicC/YloC family endoribonuclease [Paenibacillus radicis (ex Xue et al. 2023)]|uniref:YicC family protein n=1 Tax=Paenibacillus radicis (ex Xue et al. 2023) TaxID=2972489 RepID=A0ABT1YKA7_9BACL|nr:YicC/YloC family endoribonuclease [Paenibacillus radicis (ex Xue et al. 2023)]MCR8633619.1 YicC family protein [Paenibacillus radicis (ex Xue et al. 2023)]
MIRSMTGFGQANRAFAGYSVQMDLKSVNHRYCEVIVRMPREWLKYEDLLKRTILERIKRGRADLFVTIERSSAANQTAELNWTLAEAYRSAAEQLKDKFGLHEVMEVKDYLRIPDLISIKETVEVTEEEIEFALKECVGIAVTQLLHMRETEGSHLYADTLQRIEATESFLEQTKRLAPQAVLDYTAKLRLRIQELLQQTVIDEARLATEVAVFAERANVDEEITRLQSHLQQFKQLLDSMEPVGRKLDFLVQEMNREVNTIGSKANHAGLTALVVEMKAELEKMREQIQNIE